MATKAKTKKVAAEQDERQEQLAKIDETLMKKRQRAAGDATRLRITRLLGNVEWTARELAEALGVGTNGLYYHLRVLEDAELIAPGAGRATSSGMEKTYKKSDRWLVTHELNEDLILVYKSYCEVMKHECEQAVYRQIEAVQADTPVPYLNSGLPGFATTPEEIAEFGERLRALVEEFRTRAIHLEEIQTEDDPARKDLFFGYALVEKERTPWPSG